MSSTRFQSTRPCGARLPQIGNTVEFKEFQSTRPCGARHAPRRRIDHLQVVSIHAPVWGATSQKCPTLRRNQMFQSTRPCGARRLAATRNDRLLRFNPRARVGRDPDGWQPIPARIRFNPRARVGRDPFGFAMSEVIEWFQSTRPCGARQGSDELSDFAGRFNPRARVGRDHFARDLLSDCYQFQSTRPCGARQMKVIYLSPAQAFQSTRPCGARLEGRMEWKCPDRFQSTRPCGARQRAVLAGGQVLAVSIHAPVWGATSSSMRCTMRGRRFNPRARVGRDIPATAAIASCTVFQSTRPCGARRDRARRRHLARSVSIHAPVWGATAPQQSH